MTAKEYLERAYKLDQRINLRMMEISRLRELATRATGSATAGRIGGTSRRSNLENAVVRLIDLEREIDADIDRLVDLKREISRTIEKVDNIDCRNLLRLRYLCGRKWEEIAVELHFSWRQTHRLHNKALAEISKKMA